MRSIKKMEISFLQVEMLLHIPSGNSNQLKIKNNVRYLKFFRRNVLGFSASKGQNTKNYNKYVRVVILFVRSHQLLFILHKQGVIMKFANSLKTSERCTYIHTYIYMYGRV